MKIVGLKSAKAALSNYVELAQSEKILITKRGKPAAIIIGVDGEDLERVLELFGARNRNQREDE